MADNNSQAGPQGWLENWRASLWRFDEYRTTADLPYRPDTEDYERSRAVWMNRPVPPRSRRRIRRERVGPFERLYLEGGSGVKFDLDGFIPQYPSERFVAASRRCDVVKEFFTGVYALQYVRALGFGGNGIALRYRYQGRPRFDFVMKVAITGWESMSIRTEAKMSRKMARAAHSVQMIPHRGIGLPDPKPFRYEIPPFDDSSANGESSGDESRDDEPSPEARERRTRRQIIADHPEATVRKRLAHEARMRRAEEVKEDRDIALSQRRALRSRLLDDGIPPPEMPDIYDEYRKDFMLLEFCPNGDLDTLIYKVRDSRARFPNRILWSFWLCLVRGCLGMQYPPRKFHPRRHEDTPGFIDGEPYASIERLGKMVGDDLFEEVPDPRKRWASKRFVHFDIDPQNSGIDVWAKDDEHKLIPRLKLADFGSAEEVKPRKQNVYYFRLRDMGKYGYSAPEQFGQEWNYVTKEDGSIVDPDGPEISEQPIAGNYGPATNVWGIGLVMWQLMTHMEPPVPPQLQVRTGIHAELPYNYCPLILTEQQYDCYDLELREIVARCMAQDPQARPSLGQLLGNAKRGIHKRFDEETDDVIQEWVQAFIYNA